MFCGSLKFSKANDRPVISVGSALMKGRFRGLADKITFCPYLGSKYKMDFSYLMRTTLGPLIQELFRAIINQHSFGLGCFNQFSHLQLLLTSLQTLLDRLVVDG